jgi:pSer/pThr/pTyr-binding forkhead associated (FHA) protein
MTPENDPVDALEAQSLPETDALEVMNGPDDGRWLGLGAGDTWVLGRSETADLPLLLDPSVSRLHARVLWIDDRYWLEDAGSTHGTVHNGQPVAVRTQLAYGDLIALGATLLELRRGRSAPRSA